MTRIDKEISNQFKKLVEQELEAKKKLLVQELKDATPVDTGEARDGWRIDGDSIVNDVEHIEQLNEGSSQQAPSFFVERTLLSQKGVKPRGAIVRSR